MYVSAADIHAAHARSLDFCLQLSRACLDQAQDCLDLGARFTRGLLAEGGRSLAAEDAAGLHEEAGRLGRRVFKEEFPALIADLVHATAARSQHFWHLAGEQLFGARELNGHVFGRSLQALPWESGWLVQLTRRTVEGGLDAADRITASAATASGLVDAEVKETLAPSRKRTRRAA